MCYVHAAGQKFTSEGCQFKLQIYSDDVSGNNRTFFFLPIHIINTNNQPKICLFEYVNLQTKFCDHWCVDPILLDHHKLP